MQKILGLALVAALSTGVAAEDEEPELKLEALSGGLHVLYGSGGNIGVSVGDDGIFLIDDQFAPLTEAILAKVKTLSDKPVRYVLNTHYHGDHTGGNENLGKKGVAIIAHDNVRQRLSEGTVIKLWDHKTDPYAPVALPQITFNAEMSLHFNGHDARILHVSNAHTDGDSIVHFSKADVIHMGDIFFHGRLPFIDVDNGGDVDGVIAGVEMALALAGGETRIIPGHGPVTDKAALADYRDMLVEARSAVSDAKAKGMTLEEVQSLPILQDALSDRRKHFLGYVYNSVD